MGRRSWEERVYGGYVGETVSRDDIGILLGIQCIIIILIINQKQAIKSCREAIDEYADIDHINMIKSCTVCNYAGSSKSWCM